MRLSALHPLAGTGMRTSRTSTLDRGWCRNRPAPAPVPGESGEYADPAIDEKPRTAGAPMHGRQPPEVPRSVPVMPTAASAFGLPRVVMNGDRLDIQASVNLKGLKALQEMLKKYEAILEMMRPGTFGVDPEEAACHDSAADENQPLSIPNPATRGQTRPAPSGTCGTRGEHQGPVLNRDARRE